jgi:hypothetical protein
VEKTPLLFSVDFSPVGEAAVDARKRISIGKAIDALKNIGIIASESTLRFAIYTNEAGQILLSPEISVPLHQNWIAGSSPQRLQQNWIPGTSPDLICVNSVDIGAPTPHHTPHPVRYTTRPKAARD